MSDRCPATYRHTPLYDLRTVGVQCKFAPGHEGEHCGYAGFHDGDVFWPNERKPIEIIKLDPKTTDAFGRHVIDAIKTHVRHGGRMA